MECNCIERIEERLTEEMKKEYPNGEVIDNVEFQNKTIMFMGNKTELILKNPVLGRMRIGKVVRKYEVSMLPSYCPYCGEKLR
jgi:hypothetical protein